MRIYEEHTSQPRGGGKVLGCAGCMAPLAAPVMGGIITAITFGAIGMSRQGSDAAAIAAFEACPAVTAVLGSPIEKSVLSMGCGEYEGGPTSGDASWSISFYGPRGSASGSYDANYRNGGPWTVTSASVTFSDGSRITAVPCPVQQPAPEAPSPKPKAGRGRGRKR